MKASGAEKAYICIEDNKPKAIENLREILGKEEGESDPGLCPSDKISPGRGAPADSERT